MWHRVSWASERVCVSGLSSPAAQLQSYLLKWPQGPWRTKEERKAIELGPRVTHINWWCQQVATSSGAEQPGRAFLLKWGVQAGRAFLPKWGVQAGRGFLPKWAWRAFLPRWGIQVGRAFLPKCRQIPTSFVSWGTPTAKQWVSAPLEVS